ncbi:MAG: hypothetical protein HYU02_04985, partial [Thaumarchaeota archaeon]|nr:hypothetical protein [Nitrososphaerota archaeon]
GSFKIGEVVVESSDEQTFLGELEDAKVFEWLDEKPLWGLSLYGISNGLSTEFVEDVLVLLAEKIRGAGGHKAKRVMPDMIDARDGLEEISSGLVYQKNIIDLQLIRFKDSYVLAKTISAIPSNEFHQRDMERPVQNPLISLPPRVARILINLTGLNRGETLLDPFCGTGTILMEAVAMGINVIGLDKSVRRMKDTLQNLNWFRERNAIAKRVSFSVRHGDAVELDRILHKSIDGIATEPILLPPLERFLTQEEAQALLLPAFNIYKQSLKSMEAILKSGGKIAIVVPYIRLSNRKKAGFDNALLLEGTGLKVVDVGGFTFPLLARFTYDQKVIRGVLLLKKP